MEVDGVDDEAVTRGRGKRLVEAIQADAELHRALAAVVQVLVIAGARAGVDADPIARPGARRPSARSG